jgi:hypothetical protein
MDLRGIGDKTCVCLAVLGADRHEDGGGMEVGRIAKLRILDGLHLSRRFRHRGEES